MVSRGQLPGYAAALLFTLLAVLGRWLLAPVLETAVPFITLFPAVALVAWRGGYRPALLATGLGYLAANYLFIEPRYALGLHGAADAASLAAYLLSAGIIIALGEGMRRAQARGELRAADARRKQQLLEQEMLVRRLAETEVRAHREWLQVTLASIGDAVIATDTKGNVVFLNPVAEALTGWPQLEAEGQALESVFCIVNEDSRAPVESPVLRALREGSVVGLANHTILIARDGAERAIDDSAAPIRDADGTVKGVVLIFRDITERRRAEVARLRLAAIVESSEDAIFSKTPHGIVTTWNASAEALYGYTAEEAIGGSVERFVPPDRRAELAEIMRRVNRGEGTGHIETVRQRKDGTLVDVSLNVSPIHDAAGEVIGASTIVRDIMAQKRAEAEIRRLNEDLQRRVTEFETLLDVIPIGIAVAERPDCRRVWANPALARLLRLPPGAAGALAGPLDALTAACRVYQHEREVPPGELPMQRAAATGQEVGDVELDLVLPDGARRKVLAYAAPLFSPQGGVRGAICAVVDVTDRRCAEEALREADRRKDEFLATLAHELRNPLAPIRNSLELIRRAGHDDRLMEQACGVIERQVRQLVRLVDDLLDLSRITRGRVELRKERVELATVVQTALETSQPAIQQAGLDLTVTLPPSPIHLHVDPTRVAQVLANLLHNAAKYSEPGGRVSLTVTRDGAEVVLTVADTGIGIPPAFLPHVFDMFSQADESLERSRGGLGVGLSLVRGLVDMHGGTVEAHSGGPGLGSRFTVRLPVGADAEASLAKGDAGAGGAAGSSARRFLVVDDNRDAADSLRLMLTMMGHEAVSAYDGPTAIEMAGSFRPHAVLLDIGLPKLNGYEVARRIRQQPWGAEILIVALTGWGQDDVRQRAKEAGFDAHLTKPADPEALARILAEARRPDAAVRQR